MQEYGSEFFESIKEDIFDLSNGPSVFWSLLMKLDSTGTFSAADLS